MNKMIEDEMPPERIKWSEVIPQMKIGQAMKLYSRYQCNSACGSARLKGMRCRMKRNRDGSFTIWRVK